MDASKAKGAAAAGRGLGAEGAVGCYRRDRSPFLRRVVIGSIVLGAVGALLLGIAGARLPSRFAAANGAKEVPSASPGRVPMIYDVEVHALERWAIGVGLVLSALSPLLLAVELRRGLVTEDYLLLGRRTLVRQRRAGAWSVAWDRVEEIGVDERGEAIEIRLRDGSVRRVDEAFAGVDTEALAKELARVHRKAIWNLL